MLLDVGGEVRAPDFLLTLDEELDRQREHARLRQEGLCESHDKEHGSFVIRDTASAKDLLARLDIGSEIERGGCPLV